MTATFGKQHAVGRQHAIAIPSRHPRTRAVLPALGLAALLSGGVLAEGAVRLLDCTATQACDAAGACEAASEQVRFRMEPVETGVDGAGRYALHYGESESEMQAISEAGPFFWTAGTQRHTLLANSETSFLWHRLRLDTAPEASVLFLRCEFQQ